MQRISSRVIRRTARSSQRSAFATEATPRNGSFANFARDALVAVPAVVLGMFLYDQLGGSNKLLMDDQKSITSKPEEGPARNRPFAKDFADAIAELRSAFPGNQVSTLEDDLKVSSSPLNEIIKC